MAFCINCGKENSSCLCDSCRHNTDIEELCRQIIDYDLDKGKNTLWNNIAASLTDSHNFKNLVFAISDELSSPRKEHMRILCIAGNKDYVPKVSREWLYEVYEQIKDSEALNQDAKNRIRGLVMEGYVMDYRYQDAEDMAVLLTSYEKLPKQCYYTLGDFYTKTRRYETSEKFLKDGLRLYQNDDAAVQKMNDLLTDNNERRYAVESGKKEYMPASRDAKQKYCDFLTGLGFDVSVPQKSTPKPIPKDQYPEPIETRDLDFDSFVAFDVETTGVNPKIDSIIEIGAIKVLNGKIIDSKEYVFQELVKPLDRRVSAEITELTGISQDDVKNARPMWEVIIDFMNFVGDLVLVGYNSVAFDSKFLARAGRYGHIIIKNKHFDVQRYSQKFAEQLGFDTKKYTLANLSQILEIENPRAHRALADAVTTAKVFLKLKEIDDHCDDITVDDLLASIEDW